MARLNYQERQTAKALLGAREMHIRILVTDEERELIRRAARNSNRSVSAWAELNLVDVAQIETNHDDAQ